MTNPTNWPNPEQPGVPLFADMDGAHAFEYDNDSDLLIVYHWYSKESCWLEFPKCSSKEWDKRPDLDGLKYHGPVLAPTQIAEMLEAERERCAKACDDIEMREWRMWKSNADMFAQGASDGAMKCAQEIRNLGAAS